MFPLCAFRISEGLVWWRRLAGSCYCKLKALQSKKVIAGFRHRGLEEIYLTGSTRRIGPDHIRKCARILQLLDVADQPEDLNIAGLHFHGLQGKPKRWSVRVSGNYRVTFGWSGKNAADVNYEDYH